MSELYPLTTIADRRLLPKFISLYRTKAIAFSLPVSDTAALRKG